MSNRGIWIIYDMYSDPNKSEEDTSTRKPVNQSWFCYKTAQSSSVRYIDSIYRLQDWQRPPPRIVLTTETDAPHSLRAFICLLYLACRPSFDIFSSPHESCHWNILRFLNTTRSKCRRGRVEFSLTLNFSYGLLYLRMQYCYCNIWLLP